jgi:ribosomal protein S18 acetylase RimI-like enzyme
MVSRERALNVESGLYGWLRWIKEKLSCRRNHVGAYIMTIGVVDECRRLGLGTKLIDETVRILHRDFPQCSLLYLHVVTYNESAIRFYLNERNGFIRFNEIKDHYVIFEKNYDAVTLYKVIGPPTTE